MSNFLTDPEKKVLGVCNRLAQRFNISVKSVRVIWLVLGILGVLSLGGPLLIVLAAYAIMYFVLDPNPLGNLPNALLLKISIAIAVVGILEIVIASEQGWKWKKDLEEFVFYMGVAKTVIGAFGVLFTFKGKAS